MGKNKTADSIIIRVGGGIREVQRKTVDNSGYLMGGQEAAFEKKKEVAHMDIKHEPAQKIGSEKERTDSTI